MTEEIRNNTGQVVGNIINGVFYKRVFRSKHFMRILNGWGTDKDIFDRNFKEVKIMDKENDIVYVSKKEDWIHHGIRKNFGYGEQIILPLKWHEVRHRKQLSLV